MTTAKTLGPAKTAKPATPYRDYSSAEEMLANYRAINARLNRPREVIRFEAPRPVEITRPTYEATRKPRATVKAGAVYGPHPMPRDFMHLATATFSRVAANRTSLATARRIIAEVAERYESSTEEILGDRHTKLASQARHAAMAAVYDRCRRLSLVQIGKIFNRDHTTVLYAVKKLGVWRGEPSAHEREVAA